MHSDGGGGSKGPDTYPDVLFEYRNDGNRFEVARGDDGIAAYEKKPEFRYQVINYRDVPLREARVTANYPMEICLDSEVGHTAFNGAYVAQLLLTSGLYSSKDPSNNRADRTRQIPNTQALDTRNGNPIPSEEDEPLWMKMSVTCPCPAGSVMLRDSRVRSLPALLTSECH